MFYFCNQVYLNGHIKKAIKDEVENLLKKKELKEEENNVLNDIKNSSRYTKKLVEKINKILEKKEELTKEDYDKAEDEVMKEIDDENL